MAPKRIVTEKAVRNVRRVEGKSHYPVIYFNHAEVRLSGSDVEIRLGRVLEVTDDEIEIETVGAIYTSTKHARDVAEILRANLAAMDESQAIVKKQT